MHVVSAVENIIGEYKVEISRKDKQSFVVGFSSVIFASKDVFLLEISQTIIDNFFSDKIFAEHRCNHAKVHCDFERIFKNFPFVFIIRAIRCKSNFSFFSFSIVLSFFFENLFHSDFKSTLAILFSHF